MLHNPTMHDQGAVELVVNSKKLYRPISEIIAVSLNVLQLTQYRYIDLKMIHTSCASSKKNSLSTSFWRAHGCLLQYRIYHRARWARIQGPRSKGARNLEWKRRKEQRIGKKKKRLRKWINNCEICYPSSSCCDRKSKRDKFLLPFCL